MVSRTNRKLQKETYLCEDNCRPAKDEEYVHQQHCLPQNIACKLAIYAVGKFLGYIFFETNAEILKE